MTATGQPKQAPGASVVGVEAVEPGAVAELAEEAVALRAVPLEQVAPPPVRAQARAVVSPSVRLRLYFFAAFVALGVLVPFLPRWLEARGRTGAGLGLLLGLMPLAGIASPPLFGALADALALRGVLLRVACAGAAACMLLLAISVSGGASSVPLMALLLVLFSLFRAPMVTLADVAALELGADYGAIRLWGSIGFMASVLLIPRLVDPAEALALPLVTAAALLLALLAALSLPPVTRAPPVPVIAEARKLLHSGPFRRFLVVACLWMLTQNAYDATFTRHLSQLGASPTIIGVAWTVGTAAEVVLLTRSRALLARLGAVNALSFGLAAMVVRWLFIAHVTHLGALLVSQVLHAFTFALCWAALLDALKARVPAQVLATGQGLFTATTGVAAFSGALLWSALFDWAGAAPVYAGGAAVGVVALFAARLLRRRELVLASA